MATFSDGDSGSSIRTKLNRVLDAYITVQDYGAVADGATDNTAAFQSAFDTGGTIYVPGGDYLFAMQGGNNPSITIGDDTHIILDKDARLLCAGTNGAGVNAYSGVATALFINDDPTNASGGNKNISITGGQFKASGSGVAGGTFIAMRYVDNLVVSDVKLLDTDGSCRFQISHCTDVMVDNIYANYDETWFTSGAYSYEDGIRIESGCQRVTVSDCILNSGDDAIAINNEPSANVSNSTTGADITDINITNCHLDPAGGHAIRIYQESTMVAGTIKNINISNITGSPVHTVDAFSIADYTYAGADLGISNVNVSNVYLDATGITVAASESAVLVYYADKVNFSDCRFYNIPVYGFNINNSSDVILDGVHIDTARGGGDGVLVYASDKCKVTNSNILNSGAANVNIWNSDDCIVSGNYLAGATTFGVNLDGTSQSPQVINNRIKVTGAVPPVTEDGTGGVDYARVQGNDWNDYGTQAVITDTGSNSVYKDNHGLNPLAVAAITVGASPFTYTAGCTPENVSISGGTVAGINSGALALFTTTDVMIPLAPNDSITVWYSSAPTMRTFGR